jgi:hypothetical protein
MTLVILDQCSDPACDDPQPHGYSSAATGYEGCPAHRECLDPDCEYRRAHLDIIDPLDEDIDDAFNAAMRDAHGEGMDDTR